MSKRYENEICIKMTRNNTKLRVVVDVKGDTPQFEQNCVQTAVYIITNIASIFFGILTVFLLVMCRTKTLTKAQHWSYDNCTFQYSTIVYYIYSIYIFTLSTIVDYPRTNVKGIVENRSADK